MKVKVTHGRGWYEDREGETFNVKDIDYDRKEQRYLYYVGYKNGYGEGRFIGEHNCVVVEGGPDDLKGDDQPDVVHSPDHYTQGRFETIEMIEEVTKGYEGFKSYCVGNALKYLARAPYKGNEDEDLRKAAKYLEFATEGTEGNE